MDDDLDITQPAIEKQWNVWKLNPTPESNAQMLRSLDPVINRAINANVGKSNPIIRSKARAMTLQAMHTYDPSKSRLQSHIYNNLQGLKRYNAQMGTGVHVPERVMLDRRTMDSAHRELSDELGREPTDDELSERTGFNARRLARIRRSHNAMSTGFFSGMETADGEAGFDPAVQQDNHDIYLQAIYDDLSPMDKKVFEWTLGYNGNKQLQNQEIAARLRRTPGWVSQRKLMLQRMLDEAMNVNLL